MTSDFGTNDWGVWTVGPSGTFHNLRVMTAETPSFHS